ncbi:MAG TPA: YtxH domain-containing protein [Gemmatimonadaceae bacterium]|nr:YtxH domain-containing protein [Gemmatimonadaceae bacterium]
MTSEDRESPVIIERGGGQLTAFLIGLAIGAGAALLLAPQSGAQTRAAIGRRATRVRRAASRVADDLRERAEDAYESTRDGLARRARDAREGVEDVIDDVKSRVDAGRAAGRAAARAARDELQRRLADAAAERDSNDA